MDEILIRKARPSDADALWGIIDVVISTGEFYAFAPGTSRDKMLAYWCGRDANTYVAEHEGQIVGTFVIKDNQPGLGSHIANAGYMTAPSAEGRGVGTAMGRFSLEEAKRLGYKAMQFNLVVKSNEAAVRLWRRIGFEIIGEIPEAFDHKRLGLTNAYIMHKKL